MAASVHFRFHSRAIRCASTISAGGVWAASMPTESNDRHAAIIAIMP
jgi:hypothetical protein